MHFAGPIPYKNITQNVYMLVTVDRLSRFPHAETVHNCDTETANGDLGIYCNIHGIPRSIRCDQAQAFKAKYFEIFCKNRNIELIFALARDHPRTHLLIADDKKLLRRTVASWSNNLVLNLILFKVKGSYIQPTGAFSNR